MEHLSQIKTTLSDLGDPVSALLLSVHLPRLLSYLAFILFNTKVPYEDFFRIAHI